MNIRPIREEDIEQVIQLFRLNYGDDYAIPEFYDPQWVKRGIYSDHIIWMVIEDLGRVVASGAAILDFGDYNDQIAEIGRLVVDPSVGGRGLGRAMLDALVDASDDRVEFAFGEARTTHVKTQRIFDRVGLVPLGFLPMAYLMSWRESWVLSGQLFGNGRRLRQSGAVQIIAEVAPIARLALSNLELDAEVKVVENVRPYPLDASLQVDDLTGSDLVRVLKIEQGRIIDPEIFGGLHLDQGISQLQHRKAAYLVASDRGEVLGAVGFIPDPASRNLRIVELIARDEVAKGFLLRKAVEEAEQKYGAEVIDCDVSAASPRLQQTLLSLGFLPVAYVPGMVFHNTTRWDVVRMLKLNAAWELGPLELTDPAQAMFNIVTPPFIRQDEHRRRRSLIRQIPLLNGFSPLELDFFQRASTEMTAEAGRELIPDGLHILVDGEAKSSTKQFSPGDSFGALQMLGVPTAEPVYAVKNSRMLRLLPDEFQQLCERHPFLGLKLYRNLANQMLKALD